MEGTKKRQKEKSSGARCCLPRCSSTTTSSFSSLSSSLLSRSCSSFSTFIHSILFISFSSSLAYCFSSYSSSSFSLLDSSLLLSPPLPSLLPPPPPACLCVSVRRGVRAMPLPAHTVTSSAVASSERAQPCQAAESLFMSPGPALISDAHCGGRRESEPLCQQQRRPPPPIWRRIEPYERGAEHLFGVFFVLFCCFFLSYLSSRKV